MVDLMMYLIVRSFLISMLFSLSCLLGNSLDKEVMILLQVDFLFFFFFQAEDGIRDIGVTGVQTCALPILRKKTTRMARPMAASAAATVRISRAKTWPTMSFRWVEKATMLMFTASRISSIDIRMTITFFRLRKMPKTPSVKSTAATVR